MEPKHDRSLKFGPHVIKKFIGNFYNGSMKFEDFKRLRFDCFGIPVWDQLEDSNQELKALTAACLDGLTCVQRAMAGKCITQFQALATSLAETDTGNNLAIWGHSSAKGERESRRHYAMKPSHRKNLRNHQLAALSLESRASLDVDGALTECNRAHDFLATKCSDIPDDPLLYAKFKLRYFAERLQ